MKKEKGKQEGEKEKKKKEEIASRDCRAHPILSIL